MRTYHGRCAFSYQMNANAYIKRVAPSATSSACFTLFVFRRRALYSAANENSTKMRGCVPGSESGGGGEGMGDKGVDEALNENAPYFTRLTNADESVTGLNFCREDASKGSDNALM